MKWGGAVKLVPMVLACALLGFVAPAAALDPQKRITQYVRTTWSVDDGLPAYGVTAIAQTADGYLWIGTNHGLARFDGARFEVFDRRSTPAFASHDISALAPDPAGGLWIGTVGGGIARFRDGRFETFTTRQGLAGDRIVALTLAADGDLWAGGYGGLTQLRDGKVIRRYGVADGLVGDPVTALQPGDDGALWIAAIGGLNRLQHRRMDSFQRDNGLPDPALRDLYPLPDGSLLTRSIDGVLARRTAAGFERWSIPGIPDAAMVRSVLHDRHGNLWIGTEQHGLYRVRDGKTEHLGEKEGLPSDRIRTIFEDRDGNLWVGSSEAGLYRFRDGVFTTWGRPEGFGSNTVFPVVEDHAGDVWVGSNAGLVRLRGGNVSRYTTADGLSGNEIRALHESRARDSLWVGTAHSGLDRMQGGRVTQTLTTREGLPSDRINAVLEDRRGAVWIATAGGGLARYADGKVSVHTRASGLADNFVFALHEDRHGLLWVGTANGLSTLRGDRITDDARELAVSGTVLALHEDDRGVLWIGTEGHGLYRLASGQLTAYETVPGFPDDTVYCILEDAQGRVWFNSYRGVFSVLRAQLDDVAAGTQRRVESTLYGTVDGLRSSEGNGGAQPAGWRGRDGRLWFPTMGGISVIDPAKLLRDEAPLPARIESLTVDDLAVPLVAAMRLPAQTRRLEIRYTAPNLSTPERTRFRIALDGFDADWKEVGPQRVAYFTNLEPGDYRFRVAAGSYAGRWNKHPTTLQFSIAPRFHQTWWFKLLVVAAAAAMLWSVYYLRLTWLKAQNAVLRERQRIADEIHDNLAQSLSGIFYQTEAARRRMIRDPEAAEKHLQAASELASLGADAARRSVWDLNAQSAQSDDLLQAMEAAAQRLTRGRELALQIHSDGRPWCMPASVQHHVLRIAQAAIANAIEHAACQEISVRLVYAKRSLTLLVGDDGVGFDVRQDQAPGVQARRRGFGLASMRHRAQAISSQVEVQRATGGGTLVRVTIPRRQWIWHLQRLMSTAIGGRAGRAASLQDQNPAG